MLLVGAVETRVGFLGIELKAETTVGFLGDVLVVDTNVGFFGDVVVFEAVLVVCAGVGIAKDFFGDEDAVDGLGSGLIGSAIFFGSGSSFGAGG